MNKWCQNCINWTFAYDDGITKWGQCNNSFAIESIRVIKDDDIEDMFTEQFFGCVWHEAFSKTITEVPNPLDKKK